MNLNKMTAAQLEDTLAHEHAADRDSFAIDALEAEIDRRSPNSHSCPTCGKVTDGMECEWHGPTNPITMALGFGIHA